MFLRALLLVHKPGTTFEEISVLNESQLETEAFDFTMSTECPKVVFGARKKFGLIPILPKM
jgi:hypothetical protein